MIFATERSNKISTSFHLVGTLAREYHEELRVYSSVRWNPLAKNLLSQLSP